MRTEPRRDDGALSARQRRLARRLTAVLFVAQSLGSAGFLAASTINALVGAQLSGQPAWAGVPSATYQGGAALAAFGWGYAMDLLGRRGTLALGASAGVLGASVAVVAVVARSFGLLLAGLLLMGMANSALQLGRFVAAEVHPPSERGRAISYVVLGGTVGAIVGPLAAGPTGRLAHGFGVDELAGPYAASAVLFLGVVAVLVAGLRPEPADLGRELAAVFAATPGAMAVPARPMVAVLGQPATLVAVLTMVFAHAVMVMLMVITSLHMKHHDHALGNISLVISSHVLGMYAFSIVSGRLADRWGRLPVIMVGALTLCVSCLAATLSPRLLPLSASLFLLGLGWNLCYVGGSSLLADELRASERGRIQGLNDLGIGLAAAGGSFGSGLVFAALGYAAMGVLAAFAALVPLALGLWLRRQSR